MTNKNKNKNNELSISLKKNLRLRKKQISQRENKQIIGKRTRKIGVLSLYITYNKE